MLMRSLAKRIGTKVAVCRQPKAPLALNKMFSTVAANTIHITFVDQEVCGHSVFSFIFNCQ